VTERSDRASRSRAMLIDAAAAALIAGKGAFELQDIAKRARVSVGLAYHRFGSKAGLIAAVVEHFYDELERAIDLGDFRVQDWAVRERERLSRLVRFLYRDELATVVLSTLTRDPQVAVVESERWHKLIDAAARNLGRGQSRGQVARRHDAGVVAALILGGVRHAVGHALAATPRPTAPALTAQVWSFIARGLGLDEAAGAALPLKRRRRPGAA
jgi:AcrR family transcriptional regulator